MEGRKFKTSAKCSGCVSAIGAKLSEALAPGEWEIDLASPDKVLTVANPAVADSTIEELVKQAGFKIQRI